MGPFMGGAPPMSPVYSKMVMVLKHDKLIQSLFQLVCATENFTNRYTSLNFNKSVAFSSLYHYRFVFPLYVCATKNVPNRYIPNDLRYIYTFSMLPPSKIRPYLFSYRF